MLSHAIRQPINIFDAFSEVAVLQCTGLLHAPSVTYFHEYALCVPKKRAVNLYFHRTKNNLSTELELSVWRQLVLPVLALSILILMVSFVAERAFDDNYRGSAYGDYSQSDLLKLKQKIASLEAESIRLRAFAQKMVGLAKLDSELFSFDKPPAQGGLNGRNYSYSKRGRSLRQVNKDIEGLRQSMLRHSHQLERMQLVLKSRSFGDGSSLAQWPVATGYVSSQFGMRKDPFNGRLRKHRGIDIAGPTGTKVMSIADGKVIHSGRNGGYGRMIEIEHENKLRSRYAHLSATLVKKGQHVSRGDVIGRVGSSGRSTGPHLHLEVLKNNKNVNPLSYLTKRPAKR